VERLAEEQELTPKEVEKQFFSEVSPTFLLQRFEEPAEIASMIAYVCIEKASAANGEALRVDGEKVRSAFSEAFPARQAHDRRMAGA